MKKYFKFIAIGFAIVAAAACAKEQEIDFDETQDPTEEVSYGVPMTFSAFAEQLDKTKSDIDGTDIKWEEGDNIAIYDGTALNEFTVASLSNGNKNATFSGNAAEVSSYASVAPYSAASLAESVVSVSIPSTQTIIGSHCVDDQALISTAKASATNELNFTNQFTLMKISISRDDVASVYLKGNSEEGICGKMTYDTENDVLSGTPDGESIVLTYKASESASASTFPVGDYYIALWPTTFTNGFKLIMTTSANAKAAKSTSSSMSFAKNGGVNASTIDDVTTWVPSTITTAKQLKMWRRVAESYAENEEVKLGADIDLGEGGSAYAWTPVEKFLGIFNGQNNKIYNFTVSSDVDRVGFFQTLGSSNGEVAVLKDVVFGSSDGSSADGSSSITAVGADSRYVGLVGYAGINSTISGVTNFVPITMGTDVAKAMHYTGGIAGGTGSSSSFTSCTNKAPVIDNSSYANFGGSAIGGITGNLNNTVTVTSCVNEGAVTNNCDDTAYIGGIAGVCISTDPVIENCSNSGNVTNAAASMQQLNSDNTSKVGGEWQIGVGGIAGCIGNVSVIKCSNSGEIVQSGLIDWDGAYDRLETDVDSRACVGGIVGVACRTGAEIKGCTNNGRPRFEAASANHDCAAMGGIVGAVSNAAKTCSVIITKADDGTKTINNANIDEKSSRGAQTDYTCYMGGIVGLGASSNLTVSFCENNGAILTNQSQNQGTFRCGGICGMVYISTISDCVNNGRLQIHGGGTSVTAQCGGICGGSYGDYPKIIERCTNNGQVGLYKIKNGSTLGGILSEWNPKQTDIIDCVSSGKVTTGNMNSYPTDRNAQTVQDVEFGGLFGRVRSGNSAQAKSCTGCVVNCEMLVNGTSMKYKGLIFGRHYDDKLVTIGADGDPVMITTNAKILQGANANPESPTTVSFSTLSDTYPYIQGVNCRAYSATDGTSNTDKLVLYLSLVTPAQAGIN